MNICKGTPAAAGRYVIFTPCRSHQVSQYLEPSIAVWDCIRWHREPGAPIFGWLGPLPVLLADDRDFVESAPPPKEYDL